VKSFLASWALAVGLLVPTVGALVAAEVINAIAGPSSSARLLRARRVLIVVGVVLVVLVAAVIIARFEYLRT
jgi:hypothetical protein